MDVFLCNCIFLFKDDLYVIALSGKQFAFEKERFRITVY